MFIKCLPGRFRMNCCLVPASLLLLCVETAAQPPEPEKAQSSVPVISIAQLIQIIGEPPPITFKAEQADRKTVIERFSQQTGITIGTRLLARQPEGAEKPVTVDIKNLPVRQALKVLSRELKVSFRRMEGGPALETIPSTFEAAQEEGPASLNELGGIQLQGITYSRYLGFGNQQRAQPATLSLSLIAVFDPRLQVQGTSRPKIEEAVDNMGHSLISRQQDAMGGQFFPALGMGNNIPLTLIPHQQTRGITRLAGSVRLRVVTKTEKWEITDLFGDKPTTKTLPQFGNALVTMEPLRHAANGYELTIRATPQQPQQPMMVGGNSPLSFAVFRSIRLLDEEGREFNRGGYSGGGNSDGYRITLNFSARGGANNLGEPAKLVWEIPTEQRDVDVPFEFKNLPVP
jgi:hypothetical protein